MSTKLGRIVALLLVTPIVANHPRAYADTMTTTGLIVLAQQFRGDVVRNINRRSVALKLLRTVPGEGKNVAWVPEGGGQIAEAYSEGADAANFGGDVQLSATLAWGLYRANLHITKLAKDTTGAHGRVLCVSASDLWQLTPVAPSLPLVQSRRPSLRQPHLSGLRACPPVCRNRIALLLSRSIVSFDRDYPMTTCDPPSSDFMTEPT